MKLKYSFLIGVMLFLISCGGDNEVTFIEPSNFENPDGENPDGENPDEQDSDEDIVINHPKSTILIFPENNKECTEGVTVNENESRILFEWNISENTDLYELNVQNLNTNIVSKIEVETNEAELTLEKGTPYKWHVTSKSNEENTEVATSEIWQFYNAGEGDINHVPFPADVVYPAIASKLENTTTNVVLEWSANDLDEDIVEYQLLFDTVNPPIVSLGTTTTSVKEVLDITTNTTYFWQIITKDSKNNSSNSEVFWFKVE